MPAVLVLVRALVLVEPVPVGKSRALLFAVSLTTILALVVSFKIYTVNIA